MQKALESLESPKCASARFRQGLGQVPLSTGNCRGATAGAGRRRAQGGRRAQRLGSPAHSVDEQPLLHPRRAISRTPSHFILYSVECSILCNSLGWHL